MSDSKPVLAHWYKPDEQADDGTATALCGYTWVPNLDNQYDDICPPCMVEFMKIQHGMGVIVCKVDEEWDNGDE